VKGGRWWKWLGLAGLAGVAASGVVIARGQRQRTQMTPDDVRARLHRRLQDRRPEEGHADPEG
jgi:hypothetical protein